MLNTRPREHLHHQGVHIAYFTIKNDLLNGGRLAQGINATGGRAIYLRPDPDPARLTRAVLMKVTPKSDIALKERLDKALREGNESYMQLMEELFADAGWLAPQVLQGMRSSDDFYCSIFGAINVPELHNGRVVLLGDAGYATPGFGTSLAIIGGYVLAGELLNHAGDVGAALEGYEGIMLPFAKESQEGEWAMHFFNPQTQWGIDLRNSVMAFVTWIRLDRLALSLSSVLGFTEKKAPMPAYEWPAE